MTQTVSIISHQKCCWQWSHHNPSVVVDQRCSGQFLSSSSSLSSYVSCVSILISIRLRNQFVVIEVHRQRPERRTEYTRDKVAVPISCKCAEDINLMSFQLSSSSSSSSSVECIRVAIDDCGHITLISTRCVDNTKLITISIVMRVIIVVVWQLARTKVLDKTEQHHPCLSSPPSSSSRLNHCFYYIINWTTSPAAKQPF